MALNQFLASDGHGRHFVQNVFGMAHMGCAVVIGIPVLCFYIGYMIGVRGSKGLAFEFMHEQNLEAEFEKWTNKKAGL